MLGFLSSPWDLVLIVWIQVAHGGQAFGEGMDVSFASTVLVALLVDGNEPFALSIEEAA